MLSVIVIVFVIYVVRTCIKCHRKLPNLDVWVIPDLVALQISSVRSINCIVVTMFCSSKSVTFANY